LYSSFQNPPDPWKNLEGLLRTKMSETIAGGQRRQGYVITGTCWDDDTTSDLKSIPKCFWKMVCTNTNQGIAKVGVFWHQNILSTTPALKTARKQEIYQVRDQTFLNQHNILGPKTAAQIWTDEATKYYTGPAHRSALTACANANSNGFPTLNFPAITRREEVSSNFNLFHNRCDN